MNKWLWLLLAASPMTALAQGDDPIAYKCYYCTPEEKEDVALLQGVGQHYVYDVATLHIVRVEVSLRGGRLVAETFPAEDWVRKQFVGLVQLHGHHLIGSNLEPLGYFERVYLYAPGSDHARSGTYLSSKHFSALHADHGEARRIGARYLEARPVFGFLDMVASGGRLLRLELNKDGDRPPVAVLGFAGGDLARFYFEYATRRWEYLEANDGTYPVQESVDDFVIDGQATTFKYRWLDSSQRDAFMERAAHAGVAMVGTLVRHNDTTFICDRVEDRVECTIR